MRREEGFILRQTGSQYVAVAVGEVSKEFNGLGKTAPHFQKRHFHLAITPIFRKDLHFIQKEGKIKLSKIS